MDESLRGSLVVNVTSSWRACHEFKPSTAEDPPCKGAMHVKSAEAQTSSCRCAVEARKGGASSGVVLITRPWFQTTTSVAKYPLVAE
ncbi:hypothetical protein TNCV_4010171 [Trichonephila clavipes]|nr:hypothetical protein TNCV_4010171 [Trichonephila clavipes]